MARHIACAPDIARGGIGANVPKDAVYPVAFVDAEGRPLNGANLDILHTEKWATAAGECFLVGHHVWRGRQLKYVGNGRT